MRNRHGFFASALLAAAVLSGTVAHADRIAVRVRWQPSLAESVTGYRVYARPAGDFYGDPMDVGMPREEKDGTLSILVKGLDSAEDYAFAVTAYGTGGVESDLSNEGLLYAAGRVRSSCSELRCTSLQGCVPVDSPDGLGCYDGDPCSVGTCSAGACVGTADAPAPLELSVSDFTVAPAGRKRKRLMARATLPVGVAAAEPFENATIEVRDSTDRLLYFATVSSESFALKTRQNTFAYPGRRHRRAPAGANGLKKVALGFGTQGSEVSVRASSRDLDRLQGDEQLMWVVRLGNRCAQALEIGCGPMKRGRMRCK